MHWTLWVLLAVLLVDIVTNVLYYWTRRKVQEASQVLKVVGGWLFENVPEFQEHCMKLSGLSEDEWRRRIASVRK